MYVHMYLEARNAGQRKNGFCLSQILHLAFSTWNFLHRNSLLQKPSLQKVRGRRVIGTEGDASLVNNIKDQANLTAVNLEYIFLLLTATDI